MSNSFRVIAIIAAFNEGDIISSVIGHLVEHEIDVYLLDNHSTDDTVEQAGKWLGRGLLGIELFPAPLPEDHGLRDKFHWGQILERKETLAQTLKADWFIHHDADEIREGPWPGLGLRDAIRWVDTLGYNCIDFRVLNFQPVDDRFRRGDDPKTYFTFYEEGEEFDRIQIKCWKAGVMPPSLAPFGGHEVQFAGRLVFPIRFLLRHYPIRGQTHGRKKVFAERQGRFLATETSKGWHLQYNRLTDETHRFLKDPATLLPFDLDRIRLEQLLPETTLQNLADQVLRADETVVSLRQTITTLEKDRDSLKQHAANLEHDGDSLRRHITNVEGDRASLRQHAANVEGDRDRLRSQLEATDRERPRLEEVGQASTGELERAADELARQSVELERPRCDLATVESTVAELRTELVSAHQRIEAITNELAGARHRIGALLGSVSWRVTAPLRAAVRVLMRAQPRGSASERVGVSKRNP